MATALVKMRQRVDQLLSDNFEGITDEQRNAILDCMDEIADFVIEEVAQQIKKKLDSAAKAA